jgi:hypothetical protein
VPNAAANGTMTAVLHSDRNAIWTCCTSFVTRVARLAAPESRYLLLGEAGDVVDQLGPEVAGKGCSGYDAEDRGDHRAEELPEGRSEPGHRVMEMFAEVR